MIDSGVSNIVMPFEVMKKVGLMVNTTQGWYCAMDQRDVTIVGTITTMQYRLYACPRKELTMSVLVMDIPPRYDMLLSIKWSASMGESLQCDLSYTTFHIDNKLIKVNREPRSVYTIEKNIDHEMTIFIDVGINVFREEVPILEKHQVKTPIVVEVDS